MTSLKGMTQAIWNATPEHQREKLRDLSGLTPVLIGREGWRVEVVSLDDGSKRRFIVGRSSGWRPCHIELKRRDSSGGVQTQKNFASVRPLYRVRGGA